MGRGLCVFMRSDIFYEKFSAMHELFNAIHLLALKFT